MGGRQSVQTDVHRRPRANSAVAPTREGSDQNNSPRAESTSALEPTRSNVGDSTSDSDDDHQSGSTNLPSSSNHHRLRDPLTRRAEHNRRYPAVIHFSKDVVCPVCKRTVPADEAEVHIIMCITRPRVTYNEDKLTEDKGECAICLEEMVAGDIIARLECFCIYHKHCIDEWFRIKNCCPEHPGDD